MLQILMLQHIYLTVLRNNNPMKIITVTGDQRPVAIVDYQVDVYANGALGLANANLNFVNSATINASVIANGTTQANVSFSVNTSAVGGGAVGNYEVDVFANGTSVLANAKLNFVDSTNITVQAVANGTANANISFVANTALISNAAYFAANAANVTGQTAFTLANTANNNAANANVTAQTAITLAIAANTEAQTAFNLANSDVIWANGTSRVNTGNINFVNTATVNVTVTANGTTQGNVAFTVNTSAVGGTSANASTTVRGITLLIDSTGSTDNANAATANAVNQTFLVANSANTTAQAAIALAANAYVLANSDSVYQNGVLGLATANLNFNNSATVNVTVTANGTTQANLAFSVNTSAVGGGGGNYQADVLLGGSSILTNAKINLINTATVTVSAVANGTTQANISFNVPIGSNQQVLFSNGTAINGQANLLYNVASNTVHAEANIKLANATALIFGGQQSNSSVNSHFAMAYNATANSVDITFLG
jgi:hypothetical protein